MEGDLRGRERDGGTGSEMRLRIGEPNSLQILQAGSRGDEGQGDAPVAPQAGHERGRLRGGGGGGGGEGGRVSVV